MQQLAVSLGVSRATLYRRTGNRESLMAEVIWWDGRRSIIDAIRRTDASPASSGWWRSPGSFSRTASAASRCNGSSRPTQRVPFVLTGARGGVQDRYIDCFERLFELEAPRATCRASTPAVSRSP